MASGEKNYRRRLGNRAVAGYEIGGRHGRGPLGREV